jgi:cysteine desulfurase family protein
MIYFDNAATTWPKPETVYEAVDDCLRGLGANPGRSGHRMALAAGRVLTDARLLMAKLVNAPESSQIIFTVNATEALNLGIKGQLKPGDHVITSRLEHNSVARPLETLRIGGVEVTRLPTSGATGVLPAQVEAAIQENTKMIVLTHASNVTGTLNPIAEIGKIACRRKILFLVDAAQTAGVFPIDVQAMNIDVLAFAGHKGLFGPAGTGGLFLRKGIRLTPLKEGGTGTNSEFPLQPEKCPERYESGTLNTPGIAGLAAGIRYILAEGIGQIREKEKDLTERLQRGLEALPGITVYGPPLGVERAAVVSFNILGMEPSEVCLILDQAFEIAARSGLHCAPDAHRTMGTLPKGTVRLSLGYLNTTEEVDRCLEAVAAIAGEFVA